MFRGGCLRTLIFAMQRQPRLVFRVYVFSVCVQANLINIFARDARKTTKRTQQTATHSHNTFMHDKSHVILNFAPGCRAELCQQRQQQQQSPPPTPSPFSARPHVGLSESVSDARPYNVYARAHACARAWKKEHVHMLRYKRANGAPTTRARTAK